MATEFQLPDLGEDIDEAEVIGVLVAVGDAVDADQPVIEVETEKANLEVPAPHAGTISAIHVKVGDVLKVGQPLVSIDEAAAGAEPTAPAEAAPAAAEPPAVAATPSAPELLAAPPEPELPAAPPAAPVAESPPPEAPPAVDGQGTPVPASPSVRIFAREVGVPIEQVSGTGPGGRITVDDVKAHARGAARAPAPAAGGPAPEPLSDLSRYGEIERERMSGVRRATARNLAQSWAQSPLVTLQRKADITALDALRRKHRDRVAAAGGSLTMLPILMKIVAGALREFPRLNASIDIETQEIVYRRYVHLGVATDTDHGLLVPVVRDADQKTITQLAVEVRELAEKARDRKLSLDELRGGTFTISNLGAFGIGFFNAILHPPQVGILAVGRAEMEPVWIDGEFQPRLRMPLALNIDHRLIDGADGARALNWIVEAIEEPLLLVL